MFVRAICCCSKFAWPSSSCRDGSYNDPTQHEMPPTVAIGSAGLYGRAPNPPSLLNKWFYQENRTKAGVCLILYVLAFLQSTQPLHPSSRKEYFLFWQHSRKCILPIDWGNHLRRCPGQLCSAGLVLRLCLCVCMLLTYFSLADINNLLSSVTLPWVLFIVGLFYLVDDLTTFCRFCCPHPLGPLLPASPGLSAGCLRSVPWLPPRRFGWMLPDGKCSQA
jgi:hypothetical protein